jgi:hypothetical protein
LIELINSSNEPFYNGDGISLEELVSKISKNLDKVTEKIHNKVNIEGGLVGDSFDSIAYRSSILSTSTYDSVFYTNN